MPPRSPAAPDDRGGALREPPPFQLPQRLIDRALKRRGRLHAFETIEPPRTALVVIDMQDAWVAEGAIAEVPAARALVPGINRLAAALRDAGGHVAWVRSTFPADLDGGWPVFFGGVVGPGLAVRLLAALRPGGDGHALYRQLTVAPHDIQAEKCRFSAFLPGCSDLPAQLQAHGIDTVLVGGVLTNVCCDSSARDAMMLNYRAIMVADACAASTAAEHEAALATFYRSFGDVRTVAELVALAAPARG